MEPARFHGTAAEAGRSSALTTTSSSAPKRFIKQQIPDEILNDEGLNDAISVLPANYNFEIHKAVWRIKQAGARRVALQFPEGLLMYACTLSDILQTYAGVEHTFVLGDVTYGACCIDDLSAKALGADFLVHYGHSCLVPVDHTAVPCLYVFVDIQIDVDHLVETVNLNFKPGSNLIMAGTIQFSSGIQQARQRLAETFPALRIPQAKPLSPGEVLGCTAPVVADGADAIVFVADGRFHLEAMMIANPSIPAYRYDPYGRKLTAEYYDHEGMLQVRREAIMKAREAKSWGLILGTLGRQGNPRLMEMLQKHLKDQRKDCTTLLVSEVSPQKLMLMDHIEAWIQISCPRLSIDWGEGFKKPTLTTYEGLVALGVLSGWWEQEASPYPMDYYSREGGEWGSTYHRRGPARREKVQAVPAVQAA